VPGLVVSWARELLVGDYDGEDDAIVIGAYPVAVDLAPLVADWRLSQVMRVPVTHGFGPRPVFLANVSSLLPFFVLHVLLVMILVRVVLGEGYDSASKGDCEGGNGKSSANSVHVDSSALRFSTRAATLCAIVPGRD
jgi:hypothetical protein